MAQKDEKQELFQYLHAAHARHREQNASVAYRAAHIVIDMCNSFEIYNPYGQWGVNKDPITVSILTDEVVDLIAGSKKMWRKKQYKDIKAKYHNDYDVFVGALLCDHFTEKYKLTPTR